MLELCWQIWMQASEHARWRALCPDKPDCWMQQRSLHHGVRPVTVTLHSAEVASRAVHIRQSLSSIVSAELRSPSTMQARLALQQASARMDTFVFSP